MAPKKTSNNDPRRSKRNKNVPDDDDSNDIDAFALMDNNAGGAANNPPAPAASGDNENVSGDEYESPGEESGDEDKEKDETPKSKDEKPGKKPKAPHKPKIDWTAENDLKLLMIMYTSPDMCKGSKHLQKIANMFREKPTPKANEVRISKLRADGKILMGTPVEPRSDDKDVSDPEDTEVQPELPSATEETVPVVELGGAVFGGFPVTWGDLDADLRKQVKDACSKRQQEIHYAEQTPLFLAMHRRNYAAQLVREAEERTREAAETLMMMRNSGGGGSGAAPQRPETELERETRALLEQLTDRDFPKTSEKGKGKKAQATEAQETQEDEEDGGDADEEMEEGDDAPSEE